MTFNSILHHMNLSNRFSIGDLSLMLICFRIDSCGLVLMLVLLLVPGKISLLVSIRDHNLLNQNLHQKYRDLFLSFSFLVMDSIGLLLVLKVDFNHFAYDFCKEGGELGL